MTSHLTLDDPPPETVDQIRRVVARKLASSGVREPDIDVRAGEDHDGDPAIVVRVRYRGNSEPFDAQAAARALFDVNTMLHERGERRFAYIFHEEEAGA